MTKRIRFVIFSSGHVVSTGQISLQQVHEVGERLLELRNYELNKEYKQFDLPPLIPQLNRRKRADLEQPLQPASETDSCVDDLEQEELLLKSIRTQLTAHDDPFEQFFAQLPGSREQL